MAISTAKEFLDAYHPDAQEDGSVPQNADAFLAKYHGEEEKPSWLTRAGRTVQEVGRGLLDMPTYAKGSVANLMEGSRPLDETDQYDQWAEASNQLQQQRMSSPEANQKTLIGTRGDVRSAMASVPFSTVSMASSLASRAGGAGAGAVIGGALGGPPGAVIGAGIGGWGGGFAGGLAAPYRMDAGMFVRQGLDKFRQDYQAQNGREPSREELLTEQERLQPFAQQHGLWEAVPEAAGNLVAAKLFEPLLKPGGNLLLNTAKGLAGTLPEELGTETVTQMGQQRTEAQAGIDPNAPREFTSPSDWAQSFGEVAPSVANQTLLFGGAAGGARGLYNLATRRKPAQPGAENINQQPVIESPNPLGQAAKQAVNTAATSGNMPQDLGLQPQKGTEPLIEENLQTTPTESGLETPPTVYKVPWGTGEREFTDDGLRQQIETFQSVAADANQSQAIRDKAARGADWLDNYRAKVLGLEPVTAPMTAATPGEANGRQRGRTNQESGIGSRESQSPPAAAGTIPEAGTATTQPGLGGMAKGTRTGLNREALDVLAKVDAGGIPQFWTRNLKKIARANGYESKAVGGDLPTFFNWLRQRRDEGENVAKTADFGVQPIVAGAATATPSTAGTRPAQVKPNPVHPTPEPVSGAPEQSLGQVPQPGKQSGAREPLIPEQTHGVTLRTNQPNAKGTGGTQPPGTGTGAPESAIRAAPETGQDELPGRPEPETGKPVPETPRTGGHGTVAGAGLTPEVVPTLEHGNEKNDWKASQLNKPTEEANHAETVRSDQEPTSEVRQTAEGGEKRGGGDLHRPGQEPQGTVATGETAENGLKNQQESRVGKAHPTNDRKINPTTDSLFTAIAKSGGLSREEAKKQGIDPADLGRRGGGESGILRVFTNKGMTFDDMAHNILMPQGYPVTGSNDLLEAIDKELRGNKVYTPEGALQAQEKLSPQQADDKLNQEANEQAILKDLDPFDLGSPGFEFEEDAYLPQMDAYSRRMYELATLLNRFQDAAGDAILEKGAITNADNETILKELRDAIRKQIRQARAGKAQAGQGEGIRAETAETGFLEPQERPEPKPEVSFDDLFEPPTAEEQAAADKIRLKELEAEKARQRNATGQAATGGLFDQDNRQAEIISPKNNPPIISMDEAADDPVMRALQAEMHEALKEVGEAFINLNPFVMKAVQVDSAKMLPAMAKVMDVAFRMGYHSFKQNARFVLAQIRKLFGNEAADALTLRQVKAAYNFMAEGKDLADDEEAVAAVKSLDELSGASKTGADYVKKEEKPQETGHGNRQPESEISAGETGRPGEVRGLGAPTGEGVPGRRGSKAGIRAGQPEGTGAVVAGELPENVPTTLGEGVSPAAGVPAGVQGERAGAVEPQGGNAVAGLPGAGGTGLAAEGTGATAGIGGRLKPISTASAVEIKVDGADQTRLPNYHLTDPALLLGGTPKTRFAKNRDAIETYQRVQDENRQPTAEERDAIASYIGWGSFGQELFQGSWEKPVYRDGWKEENDWLRAQLGEKEWKSAQSSIINAHYTDPPTVQAMWNMAKRLGFSGGRVLEPAMGIGNFFGLMPRDLMESSELTGIEMDQLTGGMAKLLYPDANIQIKPYQDSKTADNFYDLVIGNWPFSEIGPADRRYRKLRPSLHNFFFLKALDQVRPGGLVIGITSSGTMDSKGKLARHVLDEKAEVVGVYRLPTGAFQEYAGTKVVTDIVILRKRGGETEALPKTEWLDSKPMADANGKPMLDSQGREVFVNEYWNAHPDHVLGKMTIGHGTTFGREGMIVERQSDFADELAKLPERLPENVMGLQQTGKTVRFITNNTQERQNSVTVGPDGGLYVVQGERLAALGDVARYRVKSEKETARREDQVKRLVGIRQAYGQLLDAERSGAANTVDLRKDLKSGYDAFIKEHGPLSESKGLAILSEAKDPLYPALASLEVAVPAQEGKPASYRPAEIMLRPTMRAKRAMQNPSIRDAFVLVRNESADFVDMDKVAELSKQPVKDVIADLEGSGAVFKTPAGLYEVSDVYLSGNVRQKLREALDAQEYGQDMARNIEALKKVLPKTIPYFSIEARLGASWVASEHYRQFYADLLGVTNPEEQEEIGVTATPKGWRIEMPPWINHKPEARTLHGTPFYAFGKLAQAAMNNTAITIRTKDDEGVERVDDQLTAEANAKAQKLREEFQSWIWKDAERRVNLESAYNEVMNAIAEPRYDGSFLTFDGMALQRGESEFNLRKHQQDAIWMGLAQRRGLFAHEVGCGKTAVVSGICVESRKFGLFRKPMVMAHNANSATVAREIQEMYPGARVLYIDNLARDTVKQKLYQIANDDWDAVVVPHSLIDHFALTRETLDALTRADILALEEEAVAAAQADNVDLNVNDMDDEDAMNKVRSVTAKNLVKMRNQIKKKNEEMAQRASREDAISFEHLGVDALVIDEVHSMKKPPLITRMKLKGLNVQASGEGVALHLLTGYVRGLNGGRGVFTFTGTPITNTLNEIYNQMRYVAAEDMDAAGVKEWDSWFNTFADSNTDVELTPAGEYEASTRLASFINVAELRRMAGDYMHIVFADEMPEFKPRITASGKTVFDADLTEGEKDELLNGRTENPMGRPYKKIVNDSGPMGPEQKRVRQELARLYQLFKQSGKKERRQMMLSGHPANPVMVETNAAKAGFDIRAYDVNAQEEAGNKISRMIPRVLQHYNEHPQATQAIFMEKGYKDVAVRERSGGPGQPKIKTRHQVFNAAREIVERLVAGGIPREQIAVVTGETSKEKRKEIADAMNEAKIRVVIGGTSTLGTGVNMQANLRAMHHLDAPWMPGELEQRNGRGHRQGNQWNTVMEYRYLTEGLDGRRWQVLAIKDKFIKAFLTADQNVRVIEGDAVSLDEGESASDLAESLSAAAGDPRILMREKLKSDVAKLENKERMHSFGIVDAKNQIERLTKTVAGQRDWLQRAGNDAAHVETEKQKPFSIRLGDRTYTERKEADDALKAMAQESARGDGEKIGVFRGFELKARRDYAGNPEIILTRESTLYAGPTIASIEAYLRNLSRHVQDTTEDVAENERSIAKFKEAAKTPFGQAGTLEKKKRLLKQVEDDIAKYPVPAPGWLRDGAPVGTDVYLPAKPAPEPDLVPGHGWMRPYREGDNPDQAELVEGYGWMMPADNTGDAAATAQKVTVQGHRWGTENWFVLVDEGKGGAAVALPYTEIRDENNLPVYEEQEFEKPAALAGRTATAGTGSATFNMAAPNGLMVGDEVAWNGKRYKVYRLIPPTNSAERDRTAKWRVEIANENGDVDVAALNELTSTEAAGLRQEDAGVQYSKQSINPPGGLVKGITREQAQRVADDFRAGLKGAEGLEFRVFDTLEEALGPNHNVRGRVKGFYNPKDNIIVLVAGGLNSEKDALTTLRHEVLAHFGLNLFDADTKKAILQAVANSRNRPGIDKIWQRVEDEYPEHRDNPLRLAEEVFARIAEEQPTQLQSWIDRFLAALARALRKIGVLQGTVSKAELRQLLAAIGEGIRRGAGQRTFPATNQSQFNLHLSLQPSPEGRGRLLAPNGKPSNLNEMQWKLVRTPAFKAWFGDWELAARIADLTLGQPIRLNGNEVAEFIEPLDMHQLRKRARIYGRENLVGSYVNNQTGLPIEIHPHGIDEAIRHGSGPDKLKILPAIPKILETGQVVYDGVNPKNSRGRLIVVSKLTSIDGKIFAVSAGVREDANGRLFYDHELIDISRAGGLLSQSGERREPQRPVPTPTRLNQYYRRFVAQEVHSSKAVDENGEPLPSAIEEFNAQHPDIRFSKSAQADLEDILFSKLNSASAEFNGELKRTFRQNWNKLKGKLKRQSLGVLTPIQLVEVGERLLPGMRDFEKQMHAMEKHRGQLMTGNRDGAAELQKLVEQGRLTDAQYKGVDESARLGADAIAELHSKLSDEEKNRLADVQHQATIYGLTPAEGFKVLTDSDVAAKEIAVLRRFMKQRGGQEQFNVPGEDWNQGRPTPGVRTVANLMEEERQWKRKLAFERVRKNENERVQAMYDALTPEAKKVYQLERDSHVLVSHKIENALVQMIDDSEMERKSKDSSIAKLRLDFEAQRTQGDYFPLYREGDFWVYLAGKPMPSEGPQMAVEYVNAQQIKVTSRRGFPPEIRKQLKALGGQVRKAKDQPGFYVLPAAQMERVRLSLGDRLEDKGDIEGQREFVTFHTEEERAEYVKQAEAEGREILGTGKKTENLREVVGVSGQFVGQVEDLLSQLGTDPMVAAIQDQVWQLYLQSLPELSARKHMIHRKKTPGYGQDSLLAYAHKMAHDAYGYARLKAGPPMRQTLNELKKDIEAAESPGKLGWATARLGTLRDFKRDVLDARIDNAAVRQVAKYWESKASGLDKAPVQAEHDQAMARRWGNYAKIIEQWGNDRAKLEARLNREVHRLSRRIEGAKRIKDEDGGLEFASNLFSELQQAHQAMMQPHSASWVVWANQLGYTYALALSPAAWITNALQTPVKAMPFVAARFGVGATSKAFGLAYQELMGSKGFTLDNALTGEEMQAYRVAEDTGRIDNTRVHDLWGFAEQGKGRSGWSRKWAKITGFGFHETERVNREVTFLAAFRLARSKMEYEPALDYAMRAVDKTHLNYTSMNRARAMRGDVARLALQFKTYSQGMMYLWLRSAYAAYFGKHVSAEERHEARRYLLMQAGVQIGAAGLMGLPIGALWMVAQAALTGPDDDPWDFEAEFRQAMADFFGVEGGRAASKGLLNTVGPADMYSRLSEKDLLWRESDKDLEGKDALSNLIYNLAGPSVGVVGNAMDGIRLMKEGNWQRGIEKTVPKFAMAPLKAIRYATEGAKTLKGDTLVDDMGVGEVLAQAMGFTPARLSERYEENTATKTIETRLRQRRQDLLDKAREAALNKDKEGLADAIEEIKGFNATNKEKAITRDNILASARQYARNRALAVNGMILDRKMRDKLDKRYEFAD